MPTSTPISDLGLPVRLLTWCRATRKGFAGRHALPRSWRAFFAAGFGNSSAPRGERSATGFLRRSKNSRRNFASVFRLSVRRRAGRVAGGHGISHASLRNRRARERPGAFADCRHGGHFHAAANGRAYSPRASRPCPNLRLEFHGHNDLGMATANTIAALEVRRGCRQRHRQRPRRTRRQRAAGRSGHGARLALEATAAWISRQLSALERFGRARLRAGRLPAEKPVDRQRGVPPRNGHSLRRPAGGPRTYEPFPPEESATRRTEMVVGRHSGTRLLRQKLDTLKLVVPDELLADLLAEIRRVAAQQANAT